MCEERNQSTGQPKISLDNLKDFESRLKKTVWPQKHEWAWEQVYANILQIFKRLFRQKPWYKLKKQTTDTKKNDWTPNLSWLWWSKFINMTIRDDVLNRTPLSYSPLKTNRSYCFCVNGEFDFAFLWPAEGKRRHQRRGLIWKVGRVWWKEGRMKGRSIYCGQSQTLHATL